MTGSQTFSRKAVVLLSGGLDSTVTLYAALADRVEVHALTVLYGQRHRREVEFARLHGQRAASHVVVDCDLGILAPCPLLGQGDVRGSAKIGTEKPPSYVPARNTVLLSLALSRAEIVGASEIYIGANADDFAGYPDCRDAYYQTFEALSRLATWGAGVKVVRPLQALSKAAVVAKAWQLGIDLAQTWSCYHPLSDEPCGICDACRLRADAVRLANPAPLR